MNAPVPADPERVRPGDWGALGAIVLAGAAMRAFDAGRAPMWFDEIYTTWAARGGFTRVLETSARDVHPPLHMLLVSAWAALGGESTPWLRSLSILFGLATLLVVFELGRATFGRRAGLAAAALLALHPVHVYFSQEARVYALLWLELTAAWWLGWRWLGSRRSLHGAGYVTVAGLALYTHYLSGLVLAFTAAAGLLLLWPDRDARRRVPAWIGLHFAVAALFLPQVPTFLAQNARLAGDHWTFAADARDLRDWLRGIASGSASVVPVLAALATLAFARPAGRRPAAFLVAVSLGTVLFAWWVSTRGAHLFTARYMHFALPALLVVACGGLAAGAEALGGKPAPLRLAPWLALAGLLAFEARAVVVRGPLEEAADLERVRIVLREGVRPGDVVFCSDTHALLFLAHHEPDLAKLRLVWLEDRFPYYEGALVIPDSLRGGREVFGAPRAPGARWWAVRVRHGGRNGPLTAALFDSAAAGRSRAVGSVTLWGPE